MTGSRRNPVARHARRFNRSSVHTDRRKADRRGYQKHRAKFEGDFDTDKSTT